MLMVQIRPVDILSVDVSILLHSIKFPNSPAKKAFMERQNEFILS